MNTARSVTRRRSRRQSSACAPTVRSRRRWSWWTSSNPPCREQALREKQHPAKRSFQAIRIAVNDELGAVSRMMRASIDHLNPGGRLCVITFHSLEDRIVKNAMLDAAKGCTCPPSFPVCVCGRTPKIQVLTKKPIIATMEEVRENPRARSAKLRVAVKL